MRSRRTLCPGLRCRQERRSGKLDTLGAPGRAFEGVDQMANQKSDIHILPVCTTNTYSIPAVIECPSPVSASQPSKQLSVSLLLDTGAAVSLLRKDKWDLIASPDTPLNPWNGPRLTGVEGSPLIVFGCSPIWIRLSGEVFQWTMLIVDQLTTEGILGLDFLEANSCSVNMANRCIHFPEKKIVFSIVCNLFYSESVSATNPSGSPRDNSDSSYESNGNSRSTPGASHWRSVDF